jgi:TIR domain/Putative peptidoglycan binding domain
MWEVIEMKSIFISYSSRDKDIALKLASDLKIRNHRIWLDEWQVHVGECIPTKIAEGIGSADFLIVLLSQHSVNSAWVEREWTAAYWDEVNDARVAILPVLVEPCQIPKLLQTKKYADFSSSYESGFQELIMALDYFVLLKSDTDFFRAIPIVWAEDRALEVQDKIARNEHWDSFEHYVEALPPNLQSAVQIANSIVYLATYGLSVFQLKKQMQVLGFYAGPIDDEFESDLVEAIVQFQVAYNLRHRDGIFGPLTYLKMAEVAHNLKHNG